MKPALILAGGLGTRLRSVIGDLPKPLANVAGKPFLWWLLRQLETQNVTDTYLSVGFRHEKLRASMGDNFGSMRLHYVVEDEPLGTGGAVRKALSEIPSDEVLVFNGDTFAALDLCDFIATAQSREADIAIAVAEVADTSRYGTVISNAVDIITAFQEKGQQGHGRINAGIYYLRKKVLLNDLTLPMRFSLEQDFISQRMGNLRILAIAGVRGFIDIGVPEDYQLAQTKVPILLNE